MKLITLLTTFIITLASSNVFAKTFVCTDWHIVLYNNENEVIDGTMFVGEQDGDTLTIRDWDTIKITLNYFATDMVFKYYTYTMYDIYDKDYNKTKIYGVKVYSLRKGETWKYDFEINEIWGDGVLRQTFCNYQSD